ncbi:MAG: hypothetical protein QME27_00505 [Syntrophaceae bacterium]|nr:hypothetical protein [Syntrophaceae bacterium]
MKKLIRACEILIVLLLLAKIAVVGGVLEDSRTADFFLSATQASADAPAAVSPARDVFEDDLSEERKLLASLLAKQKELDQREELLRSQEKKIEELKGEVLAKIEQLEHVEKRVTALIETADQMKADKYRSMAKVYESTPPARAASMLEKLDTRTAAIIIMNMKSKSSGPIMGYMKPDKSVVITEEITRELAKETTTAP